ncbi:DUF3310 domain-containing protein [Paenibacillus oceani]|uniref:DUF3310 domain-containing protein n=1 Tax=Paenibacillus oceani TaxID=2772510 RepID=A0A927GY77_9BACL|nr:DUF3310 domain-containing protein [Paenibacillus oceani]MBD2861616.1 DUF3310 domain-containing protein [Paenibacillus oceani]
MSHDPVNSPSHYTRGGIETIEFLEAKLSDEEFAGYCRGNILKYISRAPDKNGLEDFRKARWYLNRLIERLERQVKPHEDTKKAIRGAVLSCNRHAD